MASFSAETPRFSPQAPVKISLPRGEVPKHTGTRSSALRKVSAGRNYRP